MAHYIIPRKFCLRLRTLASWRHDIYTTFIVTGPSSNTSSRRFSTSIASFILPTHLEAQNINIYFICLELHIEDWCPPKASNTGRRCPDSWHQPWRSHTPMIPGGSRFQSFEDFLLMRSQAIAKANCCQCQYLVVLIQRSMLEETRGGQWPVRSSNSPSSLRLPLEVSLMTSWPVFSLPYSPYKHSSALELLFLWQDVVCTWSTYWRIHADLVFFFNALH